MKKALLAGAGLALLAGGAAWAQAPGGPPPGGPPAGADGQARPGIEEMGRRMHGPGGRPGMMRMMHGPKAARFHFSRGENEVDIQCATDEPTKACVDAATVLLDKLAAQR